MTTAGEPRIASGILFMCGAGVLFTIMGTFGKILGQEYSSLQVSWARAFVHFVFLLAAFLPKYGLRLLRTRRPGMQILRSAMLFSSNLCFFHAITYVPLAKASSISLSSPLVVALLAWPMLGERTTPARVAALGIGFLGVLVVIRPGTEVFQPASLLILASATFYAVYQILTRRMSATEAPETLATYAAVVGSVGMLAVLPFVGRMPDDVGDLGMFVGAGVLGAVGHYFVARSLAIAPANVVTPFAYFQLLTAVAVGYLVFHDFPDALTWLGAAIIVGAGLHIGWTQTRRA